MTKHYSAALPVAYVALRVLVVLNWLVCAAILALLLVLPHERWIMIALDLTPSPQADRLIWGLRVIAVVGLVTFPLNHIILTRLLAMTATVRAGDPFVAVNALRIRAIAWCLVGLQVVSIVNGLLAKAASSPGHPLRIDAGFSLTGWLAVLLTFVLARVFAEGAAMREDLEGTV